MSRLKSMKRMGVILSSLAMCSFGIIAVSSSSPAGASLGVPVPARRRHVAPRRHGGRRHARPAGQLHPAVLAAVPGDVRRPGRVPEGRRRPSFDVVPDLAVAHAQGDQRRQDLHLRPAQGHQVLQRQDRHGRLTSSRRSSDSSRSRTRTPARGTTTSSADRPASRRRRPAR